MRRSLVSVVATLLAFVAGVGVNRLIWAPLEKSISPAPRIEVVERVEPPVVPVPPVPAQPRAPESTIIYDFAEEKFFPIGGYSLLGTAPKEFTEVASFVIDYSGEDTPYISVFTKAGDDFEENVAIFGSVNERGVILVTGPNAKTGFQYFFDGKFLRKDLDQINGSDVAVLRGTLMKLKDGKKVAERVVSFGIQYDGC